VQLQIYYLDLYFNLKIQTKILYLYSLNINKQNVTSITVYIKPKPDKKYKTKDLYSEINIIIYKYNTQGYFWYVGKYYDHLNITMSKNAINLFFKC